MSLVSLARRDPRILRICRASLPQQSGLAVFLTEIFGELNISIRVVEIFFQILQLIVTDFSRVEIGSRDLAFDFRHLHNQGLTKEVVGHRVYVEARLFRMLFRVRVSLVVTIDDIETEPVSLPMITEAQAEAMVRLFALCARHLNRGM